MSLLRRARPLSPALLAALLLAAAHNGRGHAAMVADSPTAAASPTLGQANAALQAGEADKALALLATVEASRPGAAQASIAHNLSCRVRLTLEQWDAAAHECAEAVKLDEQSSEFHMWLGRALGQKAATASFLNAFSLAKQSRAEFEESVRLDPRNAPALADLGDFYSQAPGVVGGGTEKAQAIAAQLDKLDPVRAHHLRGAIAEQRKDFDAAEKEFKLAIGAATHPALEWTGLASFYAHRKRYPEMETAIRTAGNSASRDKQAAVAFYDGAGILAEARRNPALAASLLQSYLASANKTEEAPAFIAHLRLARMKAALGDVSAAGQERDAALNLAHDYKPAEEFNPSQAHNQDAMLR